jgi:hypothetical protein
LHLLGYYGTGISAQSTVGISNYQVTGGIGLGGTFYSDTYTIKNISIITSVTTTVGCMATFENILNGSIVVADNLTITTHL